jgi:hypothetical protein
MSAIHAKLCHIPGTSSRSTVPDLGDLLDAARGATGARPVVWRASLFIVESSISTTARPSRLRELELLP